MSIELPAPIDLYFASENTHDPSTIEMCFAPDAIVRDEGKAITGLAAIKIWRVETGEKYHHTIEPLSVSALGGKVIVRGEIAGQFPGSPIRLDHVFEIESGRITALEIR